MNKRKWWVLGAVIWMLTIFIFTQLPYFTGENTSKAVHKVVVTEHQTIHTPSVDNTEVDSMNLFIRKATHITVFGILAFLLFKSLEIYRFSYIISWFLTVLYAISDEYHQSFMPGRVSSLKDVFLFDSVGALLVLFITYLIKRKRLIKNRLRPI